ncbi:hypothetical protein BT67DRAFT_139034 [Trichocladium antarcticum]|uniref:Uncharacterized protein n=1 Tax=Trichocladium antarcticum TaxID=1450529 RepID=A0AAN6ZAJ5_9PEZI|nr:hypothetical protein BT67DRAFT_139034 [Trichocladium antarcticum]
MFGRHSTGTPSWTGFPVTNHVPVTPSPACPVCLPCRDGENGLRFSVPPFNLLPFPPAHCYLSLPVPPSIFASPFSPSTVSWLLRVPHRRFIWTLEATPYLLYNSFSIPTSLLCASPRREPRATTSTTVTTKGPTHSLFHNSLSAFSIDGSRNRQQHKTDWIHAQPNIRTSADFFVTTTTVTVPSTTFFLEFLFGDPIST